MRWSASSRISSTRPRYSSAVAPADERRSSVALRTCFTPCSAFASASGATGGPSFVGFSLAIGSLSCVIRLNFRCRGFADRADIFSAGSFENVLRPINVFAFIRVHRDQVIPLFQLLFITLCLDLRNAEADQTADDTSSGCSDRHPTKRRHNWTGGDKWTHARNCQRADSYQQPDHAADGAASSCTSRRTLRRLCRFNVTNVTRTACVRHEH